MIPSRLIKCLALAATLTAADLPKDIFERERAIGSQPGIDRLLADVELGRPEAESRLEAWLKGHPNASRNKRLTSYQILCAAYFRQQLFADGVRVCTAAETIEKGSAGNMVDLHQAYLAIGPSRWSRPP